MCAGLAWSCDAWLGPVMLSKGTSLLVSISVWKHTLRLILKDNFFSLLLIWFLKGREHLQNANPTVQIQGFFHCYV